MSETLEIHLGDRSYPIDIGVGLNGNIRRLQELHQSREQPWAVITDKRVLETLSPLFELVFHDIPVLALPAGELTKSLKALEQVYDFLASHRIDRKGGLFAVGGGVIGDLAGFAAATFLRGIELVMIPTTLLSMVDSSVGGKTGINLKAGKNLAGSFYQPSRVFIDPEHLKTLPVREFNAGMAEVIKYGMLADSNLFKQLESLDVLHPESPDLVGVIRRCCEIKAKIVSDDERETSSSGGRALLNLGHTFGHAIEKTAGYGDYLHGEAVSIGLVLATRLSLAFGHGDSSWESRVSNLLTRYQLPTRLRSSLSLDALMQAVQRDKKVQFGKLRFVGLAHLGEAVTLDNVPENLIRNIFASALSAES